MDGVARNVSKRLWLSVEAACQVRPQYTDVLSNCSCTSLHPPPLSNVFSIHACVKHVSARHGYTTFHLAVNDTSRVNNGGLISQN